MNERASHEMFVEALLALEDAIGAEEYSAYRRRLQQRLAEEPPVRAARLPHRRFPAKAHLAAAALLLSAALAFNSLRQATDTSSALAGPVVLSQRGMILPR